MRCATRRRIERASGFSVLELALVSLIVAWALAIASQALLTSYRITAGSSESLARPLLSVAESTLRRDLELAAAVGLSVSWTEMPLVIEVASSRVEYSIDAGFLQRTEVAMSGSGAGEPSTRRLAPLSRFRWRTAGPASTWVMLDRGPEQRRGRMTAVERGLLRDSDRLRSLLVTRRAQPRMGW